MKEALGKKKFVMIAISTCFVIGIALGVFIYTVLVSKPVKIVESGSLVKMTKQVLINDSDLIIQGTVTSISAPKWSNPDLKKDIPNTLERDVSINADKTFKGEYANKTVLVKDYGGRLGDVQVENLEAPHFQLNEKVIVFLSRGREGYLGKQLQDYYVVKGMHQGKFEQSKDNQEFISFLTKEKINLGSFKKEIDDAIENEKANPRKKMSDEEIAKNNEKVFGK